MDTKNKWFSHQYIAVYLLLWNILDIIVHILYYLVEPPRIAGNIIGIAVAIISLLPAMKEYRKYFSLAGFALIPIVNVTQAQMYGVFIPIAIFIGVSLFFIGKLTQMDFEKEYVKNKSSESYKRPFYFQLWFLIIVVILSTAMIFPIASLHDSYGHQFSSTVQEDTTTDLGVPQITNGLLVAFFGLDNELGQGSNNFIRDSAGMDGMPVIFSHEIDLDSMQAGDFQVNRQSGDIGFIHGVTLAPAIGEGEWRTVLLTGDYGSESDPPVSVEIVGNIYSMDKSVNFKGSMIDVVPLAEGASMVFGEVVPEAVWKSFQGDNPARYTFKASGVPDNDDIVQVVRVTWSGGIELENGQQPDDSHLTLYTVTVQAGDGSTREIHPIGFGDLFDNDNNHLLALDTTDTVISVTAQAGWLVDPNHDLNPETTVMFN